MIVVEVDDAPNRQLSAVAGVSFVTASGAFTRKDKLPASTHDPDRHQGKLQGNVECYLTGQEPQDNDADDTDRSDLRA